jgi:hypothetical protein
MYKVNGIWKKCYSLIEISLLNNKYPGYILQESGKQSDFQMAAHSSSDFPTLSEEFHRIKLQTRLLKQISTNDLNDIPPPIILNENENALEFYKPSMEKK